MFSLLFFVKGDGCDVADGEIGDDKQGTIFEGTGVNYLNIWRVWSTILIFEG